MGDQVGIASSPRHAYMAYGLRFESSFPLPELRPATHGTSDISIRYGDVPALLPQPSAHGIAWQAAPGQMLLTVQDVARYLIVENREVRIHPLPGATEVDVRVFLLGSVLGALLHARQMLVLHASVIETERGAVLFLGSCGAGKSTLLGAFLQAGYAMLADDKAGVMVNEAGVPQAMPGFPVVRLTQDAVTQLRYPVGGCQLQQSSEKYVLPVKQFSPEPLPLRAAYALTAHNRTDIRLEPLPSLDQFEVLNRHTYQRRFLHQAEQRRTHFRILGVVSNHAKVTRVLRPDHRCQIDALKARIVEDMAR
jgi:hypothetical protein